MQGLSSGRRQSSKKEDIAVIDFKGKVDNESFEGGTAENYSLQL